MNSDIKIGDRVITVDGSIEGVVDLIRSNGNIGINTTSLSGLLTLRATVTNTPTISFQNVSGGPNSAISNFTSAAQTYTVIGTNAYVTNTANIARFNTSFAGCYIAFDEGTMVFGTGTSSQTPAGRFFLQPSGNAVFTAAVRAANFGLERAGSFRGGLYTYDAITGSGTDYGLTLFAEGGTGNGNIYFCPNGSVTKVMTINTSSNVLINRTTDAGYKFDVNGTGRFTGDLTTASIIAAGSVTASSGFFDTSDSRLKIIVKDYEQPKGIENVAARMYVKNNRKELGYFAQDLQEILPSAIGQGDDGFLTLSYSQVHTAKIAHLEKEIAELKELIKSLIK